MNQAPFIARNTQAYLALRHLANVQPAQSISGLFAEDTQRASRYSLEAAGLYLDYSKNELTDKHWLQLIALAQGSQLPSWISALFRGETVNNTEQRAAWHTALRDGQQPEVLRVLEQMRVFVTRVRSGEWRGATGQPIRHIVNIGIGGSDLGPKCVCRALRGLATPAVTAHFIANVDATPALELLATLDAAETLFVITSKTFTTAETMANARMARQWLVEQLGEEAVARHFVAVSTNLKAVEAFGIDAGNVFGFWDWVGGRYSLWSAVGLSIALYLGMEVFEELLAGAHALDEHFQTASLEQNMPVLLALTGYWQSEFRGAGSRLVLAYSQDLELLVDHLQQLELESNGKSVSRDGTTVMGATSPALWGGVGTDVQHSFMQWVHQSPQVCAVDFIQPLRARHDKTAQHQLLVANCFAQSAALMRGKSLPQVQKELTAAGLSDSEVQRLAPHRVFSGNRPSNTLLIDELTPRTLGALIALYEHRTFVLAVLWDINPFDQWGVEYGKQLTQQLEALMSGQASTEQDGSTLALLKRYRSAQK